MKIKAIAPWFGSKRTLAPRIIEAIGPHRSYWEPFCGSMAVLLAKEPSRAETVNDLHGDVTNLARVIASDDAPSLYERLMRTSFCEALHAEARDRLSDKLQPIDAAYYFFVASWMAMNDIAGTRSKNNSFCRRYTSNGGDPALRFKNAVESIPPWHHRLRGVQIWTSDGFEVIERIEDKPGTVIYADPPYLVKSDTYVHDFADGDHDRLAKLLSRFKHTRVVVSYYDHAELGRLYPYWRKIDCTMSKALANPVEGRGVGKAPEVLLVNTGEGELFQ